MVGVAVGVLVLSSLTLGIHELGNEVPKAQAGGKVGVAGMGLDQQLQGTPGAIGAPNEGPGTAIEQAFQARAYPADSISLTKIQGAQNAFRRASGRLPRGEGKKGTWVTVGPSSALYPATEFRDSGSYVPAAYVAGGRTTSMALSPTCRPGACRMWATPAGGGVWRTEDALAIRVRWKYLGGTFGINAAGSVTIDPNDATGNTIYVGTGEANVCGSGCVAGIGLYKSTNGGDTWQGPLGENVLGGKGIGDIIIKPGEPKTLYVGTTTALRGMSSVCCTGITRPVPGAAKWGLYKSTDGGTSWAFVHNGSTDATQCTGSQDEFNNTSACSPRGVRHVELDPSNPTTVYAGSYARGVWRSTDEGATWTQIKQSLAPTIFTTRPAFDVVKLPNGKTRMYVHEGNTGAPYSQLFRSDDVATGTPAFQALTSSNPAEAGFASYNVCGAQCWYDLFVYTPDGHPDIVYMGGSYGYGETGGISNGRGVVLSTDAGVSGTDMTMDGTDPVHPNAFHPDQHDLVTLPGNPYVFFEANDGGMMRSSGQFTNVSSWCDTRGLQPTPLARCKQLLSRVPTKLTGMNDGLSTLQFISLSVSPHDEKMVQGGTQDNGTWQRYAGSPVVWKNTIIGDGGWSGFDVERPEFRFHTFTGTSPEVNFNHGETADWIRASDPMGSIPGAQFYAPVISDPVVSGTMFAGSGRTVHRTTTFGLGNRTLAEANRLCNRWTGVGGVACGDWRETGPTPLTGPEWGDRAGGAVAAVERTNANRSTAWAATTTGRVFVSTNIDAANPADVRWTRLDDDVANDPNRFVSSIAVDPTNPLRAYVSYSGFTATTPSTPGHVFAVELAGSGVATWTNLSHDLADMPITDLVRDDVRGDLYASTDFGVLRLTSGTTTWTLAAPGMPNVEVAGLTIVSDKRILYAATHGLSAWRMNLR